MKKALICLFRIIIVTVILSLALTVLFILTNNLQAAKICLIVFLPLAAISIITMFVYTLIDLFRKIKTYGFLKAIKPMLFYFFIFFIGVLLLKRIFMREWQISEALLAGLTFSLITYATNSKQEGGFFSKLRKYVEKEEIIDIDQAASEITAAFPMVYFEISEEMSGNYKSIIFVLNNQNDRFPLTIRLDEQDGISIHFGYYSVCEMTTGENGIEAIRHLLEDKLIIYSHFKNEKDFQDKKYNISRCWYDMDFDDCHYIERRIGIQGYKKFLYKIQKPMKLYQRLNPFRKTGIFEFSDWSGSRYQKIIRD